LQPKTIQAYSRAIRRIGGYFHYKIDGLSEAQLRDYFTDRLNSHSWSAVKLDLYGLTTANYTRLTAPPVLARILHEAFEIQGQAGYADCSIGRRSMAQAMV